uniref:ATP-binding protein n=1 Tax=Steinernema glaseri TaxID=37863 RepID=A0A1I8A528_9BILA
MFSIYQSLEGIREHRRRSFGRNSCQVIVLEEAEHVPQDKADMITMCQWQHTAWILRKRGCYLALHSAGNSAFSAWGDRIIAAARAATLMPTMNAASSSAA